MLGSIFLSIVLFLLNFILLRHVCLDELGDEVTILSVTVSNGAEPIDFVRTLLKLILVGDCFAIRHDLGDKDYVLVDLSAGSPSNVSSD